MATFISDLLDSIVEMPARFVDVAMHDPIGAVLIAFGALFVGLAVLAGGVLSLGAALDLLRPFRPAREHRPRGR
ncbi:hypothetical protein [Halorhabdus amylolytica]|uniref:hypothetical protein n=1 Tax=Halorhabdus amylolytica TaxID=2559573 RepID=UPI0010AA8FBA|nr:hypothetical protein [Halorhabdus amylolytica]